MGNWLGRHPGRYDRWHNWGDNVRFNFNNFNVYNNCFTPSWWGNHYHGIGGWHYGHCFNQLPVELLVDRADVCRVDELV